MSSRAARWRVPTLLLGFTIFFYWKILFTNRYMFPWDAADFFYPYLSFVHEELRHFRLPLWDPYVMSGYPILGDLEAQIFYPINWLFVLANPFSRLPYKLVEIQVILHFFLAGLFMYYLARDFTQDAVAALLGGVLFMSSGAMVAHTQHLAQISAMAWYPPIFLLARRGLLERNFSYSVSAGMLFGVQLLAGHWQHSAYLGLLLFLYFLYESCLGPLRSRLWPQWISMLLTIAGVGAGLAMVQILPTRELGFLSVRTQLTYWDVTNGNEPNYLWTLFLPNFFGGLHGIPRWHPTDISLTYVFLTVPGLLLAGLGLVETVRRRNFFWLGTVLLLAELSLGQNGHLAEVIYRIPILNLFRNPGRYFDPASFLLCLLAAVGAHALFSKNLPRRLEKYLPLGLTLLLLLLTVLGLVLRLGERIHGWYHMLAVLAVFSVIVAAMLAKKLSRRASQGAILGLILFQLIHYNMNQKFNWTINDPRTYVSYEYAIGRKVSLHFLRSDRAADFRVAAMAEHPWSGNGWNVWRIPSIYGWNPITLRRYEHYIRGFTQTSDYTLPYGGSDHNLNSPMLDLLGTKYVVLIYPAAFEQEPSLRESGKYELVYDDQLWMKIYRNKEYLPRSWFYPKAYVVPNEAVAIALMSSNWFQARQTLLFEKGDVGRAPTSLVEELPTINLRLSDAVASNGKVTVDPYCAAGLPMFTEWGGQGHWLRYEAPGPAEPGRYSLLMQYTAGYSPTPSVQIEVENGNHKQGNGPLRLPGTYGWDCHKTRTVELGEFELQPGRNQITLTSLLDSLANIYSLWLVRLPSAPPETGPFSVENFSVSANRISFNVRTSQDGFLLLNEIYYPGWEATVDGQPAEILRADSIFRALLVPAGFHHVEFRFRTRYFAWGATLSLLTLTGFLVFVVVGYRRRHT